MTSHPLRLPSAWRSFVSTGCQVWDLLARYRDSSGNALPQPLPLIVATGPAWRRGVPLARGKPRPPRDAVPRRGVAILSRRAPAQGGWRAEERKTFWCPCPLPDTAGAFRRDTCAKAHAHFATIFSLHAGPRFRRQCAASPATDVSPSDVGGLHLDPTGQGPRVVDLTVVSQLLAGPRSGPGPSPGAARVPICETS
jgi:hypothetical protein